MNRFHVFLLFSTFKILFFIFKIRLNKILSWLYEDKEPQLGEITTKVNFSSSVLKRIGLSGINYSSHFTTAEKGIITVFCLIPLFSTTNLCEDTTTSITTSGSFRKKVNAFRNARNLCRNFSGVTGSS